MKESASSIIAAVITIFLTGCIIIAHDISKDFRQSLTALTGHHWITSEHGSSDIICALLGASVGLEEHKKDLEGI